MLSNASTHRCLACCRPIEISDVLHTGLSELEMASHAVWTLSKDEGELTPPWPPRAVLPRARLAQDHRREEGKEEDNDEDGDDKDFQACMLCV